jgi:hypothetical protein
MLLQQKSHRAYILPSQLPQEQTGAKPVPGSNMMNNWTQADRLPWQTQSVNIPVNPSRLAGKSTVQTVRHRSGVGSETGPFTFSGTEGNFLFK